MKITEAELRKLANVPEGHLKKQLPKAQGKIMYDGILSKARDLQSEAIMIKDPLQAAKFQDLIESVLFMQKEDKDSKD